MKARILFILWVFLIFEIACSSLRKYNDTNLSYLYNNGPNNINPSFVVYHKSADQSTLYFALKRSDLLQAKPNNSDKFRVGFKLSYRLREDFGSKIIADSATIIKFDSSFLRNNDLIFDSISIKAAYPNVYVLSIKIVDINKKTTFESFLKVDKTNPFNAQNFLTRSSENLPVFKDYLSSYEPVSIHFNNSNCKKLFVKHFNTQFPAAIPPFSEVKETIVKIKPDSIYTLDLINSKTNVSRFKREGIYFIQSDTTIKKGLTIFRYSDDFPDITSTIDMLYPLRYLTTKNEYESMIYTKDKKTEIDNFWIEIGGNPDRAKQLIKKYYSRVKQANILFSSYLEGWKTDRGIIYIIYGEPNVVNRNSVSETWYYGTPQNLKSIIFNFYKADNPFTDNDYNLARSSNYKNSWYIAIENWRR